MLLVAAVIADLCGPPPAPATPSDPADAASYAQVGDDARAHADLRIAAIAYRKALELDPANLHARDTLAALCRATATDGGALLAATALYHAGELDAAAAAFAAIAALGGADAAAAHLFVGLIALRLHEGGTAVAELEAARADPEYAELATTMLRLAHRDGAVAALFAIENELDTNPQLLPDTPPVGATNGARQADDDLLLLGTITARPWRWLALRDVLSWRKQVTLTSLDFLGESAQAGFVVDRGTNHVDLRYDFDDDVLDGSSYLIASRATLDVHHDLSDVTFGASYAVRRREYQQPAELPFSGWVHAVDISALVHLTPHFDLEVRGFGWRELTTDLVFANSTGGAQVGTRTLLGGRTRLATAANLWYSRYDAAEPDGTLREDVHGEVNADLEVDLGDHVLAVAGASVLGNRSTVEDFRYWKVVVRCGIAIALGGP